MKNSKNSMILTESAKPPAGLTFEALVKKIRVTLAAGRARAEEAVDRERARSYWETGRWIHTYQLKGQDRAKYGDKLIPELAKRFGLGEALVYDMLLFYRQIPIVYVRRELGWTDYRRLLRVKDDSKRLALIREAVRKKWKAGRLETEIEKLTAIEVKADRHTRESTIRPKPLIPRRGKFFTYRIVRPSNMHTPEETYSLDLGFRARRHMELTGVENPKVGEIVRVVRAEKNPAGDKYEFVRDKSLTKKDLYTYKAKAQIYRDADTFWVDADFGFRQWMEQKLRLRGIDSKELEDGGKKAARYVKKVLSRVPFIVITISGRDKFGRPLADVFYLEGTEDREKVLREGKFLNQELLDLGLAKRV